MRWYGLIEDYRFSPLHKPRAGNRNGNIIQNPDAFACKRCRMGNILCFGHREHPNRKCTPCGIFDLRCSKEEGFDNKRDRSGSGLVPDLACPPWAIAGRQGFDQWKVDELVKECPPPSAYVRGLKAGGIFRVELGSRFPEKTSTEG